MSWKSFVIIATVAVSSLVAGCATNAPRPATPAPAMSARANERSPIAGALQLVLVTTPAWDSTSGVLRRYERDTRSQSWRSAGADVPIVVGQTGLAWDAALGLAAAGEPVKREGDGKSPAGAFVLDSAFGFDVGQNLPWIRLPYSQLRTSTECVDDSRSTYYNAIVDRTRVARVDWTSSEKMRQIQQYAFGVHVAYNTTPMKAGGGSCIFLHIWAGASSVTAGCTAMEEGALRELLRWLAPERRPMIVQLPSGVLPRVGAEWGLP